MKYADRLRQCVTASRGIDLRDPDLLLNSAAALDAAERALVLVSDDLTSVDAWRAIARAIALMRNDTE
jgi:hypothetical protein